MIEQLETRLDNIVLGIQPAKMVTVEQIESIIVGTAIMAGDEELAAQRIYKLFYGAQNEPR